MAATTPDSTTTPKPESVKEVITTNDESDEKAAARLPGDGSENFTAEIPGTGPDDVVERREVEEWIRRRSLGAAAFSIDVPKLDEVAFDNILWSQYPNNPHNWSKARKWCATAIVAVYTFVPPLASSMVAPCLPAISEYYNITNPTIQALTLSIFVLAFCIGPLIIAPLSEIYGRREILHISNVSFIIFNLFCAFAPNGVSLIVFRFLAGLGGATPIAIGGSVVADIFPPQERAAAMAVYTMGPLMAPALGPLVGGYISETVGFRWLFISLTCFGALASLVGVPFLQETYHPILRARLAITSTGDKERASVLIEGANHGLSKRRFLWISLTRPIALMSKSFILNVLSLFMAVQYGFLYLMFTTFPTVFSKGYGFSPGQTGLCYLGLGIGFFISLLYGATFSNSVYLKLAARNGGVAKPEYRIPTMLVGSFMIPVGLFLYGWTSTPTIHWSVPLLGTAIFGAGMMTTYLPAQLYIVDTFQYAASALAAASIVRSLMGFAFPLFATQMFAAIGNGPGYSILGGVAILLGWPFPVWIYFYGERIRAKSDVNR